MIIVFCRDPLEPSRPDRAFEAEASASELLGLPNVLVDHDALTQGGNPERATRRVSDQTHPALALYRGWMLTPPQYRMLFEALDAKGVRLINDPAQYRHCHYLPESYPFIEGHTPRSVWVTGDLGLDRIMERLAPFGDGPVVVKDFVKSRKHEWREACFIPSASDRGTVERVAGRFLELQGDDLAEGLVFREFIEFEPLGVHPRSGMPIVKEYRTFWLDGAPIFLSEYWEDEGYDDEGPPLDRFDVVVSSIQSRFFTMDLARRRGGEWMIVELGDGQVSGLPKDADAVHFYKALDIHCPS